MAETVCVKRVHPALSFYVKLKLCQAVGAVIPADGNVIPADVAVGIGKRDPSVRDIPCESQCQQRGPAGSRIGSS